jgi:transposase
MLLEVQYSMTPQLKRSHAKKLDEIKHKLTVLNAVANKLMLRIFTVVNREEPFVKLSV